MESEFQNAIYLIKRKSLEWSAGLCGLDRDIGDNQIARVWVSLRR